MDMHYVTSRDVTRIGYIQSGSGPPLLLVHGATADHQRWSTITPRFEPYFTVYAMDRRGRGASGDGPDYHLLREVEDVAAVADAVTQATGEPVSVLGHSYGGLCSLEAALLTDSIGRLILYEPTDMPAGHATLPREVIERMQAHVDQGELEPALEVMMREIVHMPEHELSRYRSLPMWQRRVEIVPTVPRELAIDFAYRFEPERFAELQVPTLLLLGGDSQAPTRKAVEVVAAALPNSRIAVMPGQQHVAMDMDPDLFTREVLRFLQA